MRKPCFRALRRKECLSGAPIRCPGAAPWPSG
jgi:hypothetical protein